MTPLANVRVLDLTRLLPGAHVTLLLADLGADVVKIEDPRGGDPGRRLPPVPGGTSAYFQVLNRNKRSVTLNLRSPDAASVLDAVLAQTDIVVESFRPPTARRLGVDAATLRARHPRLIHASINGFGDAGPSVARAAHDINFQAISGLLAVATRTERDRFAKRFDGQVRNIIRGEAVGALQCERGFDRRLRPAAYGVRLEVLLLLANPPARAQVIPVWRCIVAFDRQRRRAGESGAREQRSGHACVGAPAGTVLDHRRRIADT